MATGLGSVMKAWDVKQTQPQAPMSHRLFSSLLYGSGERDLPSNSVDIPEDDGGRAGWSEIPDVQEGGGWLESDDIEDC